MSKQLSELPLEHCFYERPGASRVLICLHGRGDSMNGLMWLRHYLDLSEFHQLYLNAPDSWPTPYGKGYSWYPMKPDHKTGIFRSAELVSQVLDSLSQIGLKASDAILFGFSQGAVISLETALSRRSDVLGVIAISGFVFEAERLKNSMNTNQKITPVLMTHGFQDSVLDYEITKNQAEILKSVMPNLRFEGMSKEHHIVNQEIDWYRDFLLACHREALRNGK
ncbi:MAG: hypothetical protein H3C47_10885 [Candidatus Cloacimonetes bacterium]|nr:hypothetical protein [Candidatus Cloacimonadota bacterium]